MKSMAVVFLAFLATSLCAQNLKFTDPEKSVVQIAVVRADNSIVPCGTGFFVRDDGLIATAFHVYSAAIQVMSEARGAAVVVRRATRQSGIFIAAEVELKSTDATHDLALLKLRKLEDSAWAKVGGIKTLSPSSITEAEPATNVRVIGYFGADIFPVTRRASLVGESMLTPVNGSAVPEFLVSAGSIPGESGSPILLEDGSVLGVLLSMVPVTVPAFSSQALPSGLNRAAKAEFLQRLITSLPR
jgi:S1-C subfamily serine protease